MSAQSRFERLQLLPPYVLGQVDEVKRRLAAEGRTIYDFGLGNPDGTPPQRVLESLKKELSVAGFQRYQPSRGLAQPRRAICDWYQRRYQQSFDSETEAVVTIGSKEGIAHLLFAIVGQGECVLVPDPAYPIHRLGVVMAGGVPVSVSVGPGMDHVAQLMAALKTAPRKPRGIVVNFPHNPTSAVADLRFYETVVDLALREGMWVISDLAYADLMLDGSRPPSIFQVPRAREVAVEFFTVSKSYNMPGWRVGFAVGNRELIEAVTTLKGYTDYGIFAPNQLSAATALNECDDAIVEIRERYRHRAAVLAKGLNAAGWPVEAPAATMFLWAPIPERYRKEGAVAFASRLLQQAGVAVAPGVAFGPGGEGHVRFSLIEDDARVALACQAIASFLAG